MKKILVVLVLAAITTVPPTFVSARDDIETAGDITQVALPISAIIMALAHDDQEGLRQFTKSFLLTQAVTHGLKHAIDAERPDGGRHSFPSGHTSAAFSGAAFIQERYGWRYGFPAYILAGFTGYSRVHANRHYWHDILAGAAIAVAINMIFTTEHNKNVLINYIPLEKGGGIMLSFSF